MATNNVANLGSMTAHGIFIGQGTSAPVFTVLTDGQLLIGSTGNDPTASTITPGAGISVTNGAGTITIAATGAGFTWTDVTGTSQTLAVENGYIADNAALVTFTLPASANLGDQMEIVGKGAGGWSITCNAGQVIHLGNVASTAAGTVSSTNQYDRIRLTCITAGASTIYSANWVGNLSYT